MRTLLLPALIAPLLCGQAPTSSLSAFRFDPAKVPVGRLMRYTKSNRDGSKAIEVLVRVNGPKEIEVLKIENRGRYLAHLRGEMDWATFTVGKLTSWNKLESGEPNLQAVMTLDKDRNRYAATLGQAFAPAAIGHYPVVVYNFDFIGANLIWPFLKHPEAGLDLGICDPDFAYLATKMTGAGDHPGAFTYRGKATFRFVGDADHQGIPCRKYVVAGPAFGGQEGTLLVNKAHGYWELFEHPQADNPEWKDFKFELQSVETLNAEAWKQVFDGIVAKAQGPEALPTFQPSGLPAPRLLKEGIAAADAQSWVEAIRLLQEFTLGNPWVGEAWTNLGDAYYELKHFDRGAEAYRKAAELGVQPAQTRYWSAGCLALGGKNEAALLELRTAMDLGLENPQGALEDKDFKSLHQDPGFRALMGAKPEGTYDRMGRWSHDLQWLVKELKRKHVHLTAKVDLARLDAEVARLEADLPTLSEGAIVVRMTQLMALVGDGHTALIPPVPGQWPYSMGLPLPALKLPHLPLRFFVFPDGVRIVATTKEHERLLGAVVLKVSGQPIQEVMERLTTTISRENAQWVKEQLPARLQVPAILKGVGLGHSEMETTLTLSIRGVSEEVNVAALPVADPPTWVEAAAPSLTEHRDKPYWARHIPATNTMLVRYNLCRKDTEAPQSFWARVIREAEDKKVTRFIVDLSANSGGNNALNKPMVEGLRHSAWLNQPGRLYVITGRATFSAGMNAVADLARETRAIFVGEPTGSAPNFAGEAAPVVLPFSGLRAMVSSRYFQGGDPTDKRCWIAPSLRVEPDFEAWKAGRDRALEAILAQPLPEPSH